MVSLTRGILYIANKLTPVQAFPHPSCCLYLYTVRLMYFNDGNAGLCSGSGEHARSLSTARRDEKKRAEVMIRLRPQPEQGALAQGPRRLYVVGGGDVLAPAPLPLPSGAQRCSEDGEYGVTGVEASERGCIFIFAVCNTYRSAQHGAYIVCGRQMPQTSRSR